MRRTRSAGGVVAPDENAAAKIGSYGKLKLPVMCTNMTNLSQAGLDWHGAGRAVAISGAGAGRGVGLAEP